MTATPRLSNRQYTYNFVNWTNACGNAPTRSCRITGNIERVVNEYPVVFQNDDGTVLRSGMMAYGETPEYTGADPTKDADAQYTYSWT